MFQNIVLLWADQYDHKTLKFALVQSVGFHGIYVATRSGEFTKLLIYPRMQSMFQLQSIHIYIAHLMMLSV